MIVAARFLGVAHPPGFPLYVMLANFASLVPIGNVAVADQLCSAFFAALASRCSRWSWPSSSSRLHTSPNCSAGRKGGTKGWKISPHSMGILWRMAIPVGCSRSLPRSALGCSLHFRGTLWSYATIAEVYTLNAFLILTVFFLMLRWRRRVVEDERSTSVVASRA